MTDNKYPTYKPSRVEWIGEIPEHWEVKKLKYLLLNSLEYGANETAEQEVLTDPRYIRITDFDETGFLRLDTFKSLPIDIAKEFLLQNGDILFARSGATVGKTFQFKNYEGEACFAGYLIRARPDETLVLSDFLYLFTKSGVYEHWKNSIFNQATIQNIGADKYATMALPIPHISEQKAIASYLDKKTALIDSTIRQKERLIELLQEERTAIINQAVTRGLDPNVKMKDSGVQWLGQIPEHWEVKRFKYFSTLKNGYAFKSENYVEEGIPVIRIGDIASPIDFTETKKITTEESKELQEFIISKGDILIALTGATIGKSCIYSVDDLALLNQRVGLIRPTEKVTTSFLAFLVSTDLFRRNIDYECIGGAQENIGKEQLGGFVFPLPFKKEQQAIASYLDKKTALIDETIYNKKKEISLLQEYRTSLINEVVTGKRCVLDESES